MIETDPAPAYVRKAELAKILRLFDVEAVKAALKERYGVPTERR